VRVWAGIPRRAISWRRSIWPRAGFSSHLGITVIPLRRRSRGHSCSPRARPRYFRCSSGAAQTPRSPRRCRWASRRSVPTLATSTASSGSHPVESCSRCRRASCPKVQRRSLRRHHVASRRHTARDTGALARCALTVHREAVRRPRRPGDCPSRWTVRMRHASTYRPRGTPGDGLVDITPEGRRRRGHPQPAVQTHRVSPDRERGEVP
jgi:hypothetical protein